MVPGRLLISPRGLRLGVGRGIQYDRGVIRESNKNSSDSILSAGSERVESAEM
jgi:hypothetical protein